MPWWKREPESARVDLSSRAPSLFDSAKLDMITGPPIVSLYVLQDEPWASSPEELDSLTDKLSMYVAYVRDGHMADQYPQLVGHPWRIVIDSYTGRPDEATMRALRVMGDQVAAQGGDLIFHELLPPVRGTTMPTTVRAMRLRVRGEEPVSLESRG